MKSVIDMGADPEVHMFDREEGRIVSSLRILKNDKSTPIELGNGIRFYADNVLTEFTVPPCSSVADMMVNLRNAMGRVQEKLGSRYLLFPKAAHHYPEEELATKKAWEIGCNPSRDAYTNSKRIPSDFTDGLRTGSFHIHIGHPKAEGHTRAPKIEIIKLMDIFVGCASVIFDADETAPLRRALYGHAGDFRPTPYGCEYRVLGNWPLHSPASTELVWDLTSYAIEQFDQGNGPEIIEAVGSERPQRAINQNKKNIAMEVLSIVGLPSELMQRINREYKFTSLQSAWQI